MLLLKATERNWGLIGPGDWDKHSWKINDDGWYEYKETFRSNSAEKLAEILKAKGCPKVAMADLTRDDQAEAVEDAFRYGKMAVLAASYDGGLFSPAYNFLHTLQMKAYQQRRVALVENGSWAPSAGRVMKEMFAAMKAVEVAGPLVTIRSRMKAEDIPALEALADALLA